MRVNQKVKAIFKLHSNQDREELAHCAVLTMPAEEFSHVQYSVLPSVKWQQQGRKHGRSFARLHHQRTTWRSAVSLGRRSETCGNSPSYLGSVWTEHHESTKGLWVGGKVKIGSNTCYWWSSFWSAINIAHTRPKEQPKSFFSAGIQKLVERYKNALCCKMIYKIVHSYFY